MSLAVLADHLAAKGRNGDSMLVHMSPDEVAALQELAKAHGLELTINPETGLPEAFSLKRLLKAVLPAVAGFALGPAGFGIVSSALGAGAVVGGVTALATGSLERGLMAGLGAYGGANIGAGLSSMGSTALEGAAATQAAQQATALGITDPSAYSAFVNQAGQQALTNAAKSSILTEGAKAAFSAPTDFLKAVGGGNMAKGIGALSYAAIPAMAAAVPTTTPMPQPVTSTPYIRPMIMNRRVNPNPQFAPGTGSSERRWFDTTYEVPPPINLLTGKPVGAAPAPGTPAPTWAPPTNPYEPPMEPPGGLADGGLVAFADGGVPKDVWDIVPLPRVIHDPNSTVSFGPPGAPVDPGVNPNFTGTPYTGPGMTGDSKAAFDYLMGRTPAPPAPAPAPAPATTPNIVMPRTITQDAGGGTGGGGEGGGAPYGGTRGGNFVGGNIVGGSVGGGGDVFGGIGDVGGNVLDRLAPVEDRFDPTYVSDRPPGDLAPVEDRFVSPLPTDIPDWDVSSGITIPDWDYLPPATNTSASQDALTLRDQQEMQMFSDQSQRLLTGNNFTNPFAREETARFARGGIANLGYNLGGYSDGGRLLRGPGDGVSDSIPATIGRGRQPARLADGEFVIPARIVSELGNGSTEAGARQLYAMMDRIQKARRKTVGKGRVAKDTKAHKLLPA